MTARLQITLHAVEQYQRRWVPALTIAQARLELVHACELGACATRDRTPKGDQIWRVGAVRLVVKRDHGGSAPVVVTVLPPVHGDGGDGPTIDEEEDRRISQETTKWMLDISLREAATESQEKLAALKVANRAYEAARRHEADVRARVSALTPLLP
jgi:hypothetical protein